MTTGIIGWWNMAQIRRDSEKVTQLDFHISGNVQWTDLYSLNRRLSRDSCFRSVWFGKKVTKALRK